MRTPPKTSPALDTRVYDIKAKIAVAIVGSGGDVTYDNDKIFTVHTGDKSSKRRPYTETQGSSYSYEGKDFEVHFKDKSKKNTDEAKKLVDDLIAALKREFKFATEPKEKQKRVKSSSATTHSSTAGFTATTAQPSNAVSQFTTTPKILTREQNDSTAGSLTTTNLENLQFLIKEFTKEPSIATNDMSGNSEHGE